MSVADAQQQPVLAQRRKNGAPVTSAYSRSVEDSSALLDQLDFSQAFKTTHLGTALCYSNPMQEKFLERRLADTQKQQKRCGNALYHTQRTFFITQVFEKGLNPYLKKHGREGTPGKPNHTQSARTPRGHYGSEESRGHYGGEESGRHYDTKARVDRPHTENQHRSHKEDPDNLPVLRSKTIGDIKSSKKSVQIWDYTTKPASSKEKDDSKDIKPEPEKKSSQKDSENAQKTLPKIKEGTKSRRKADVLIVSSAKDRSVKSATKLPKLSEEDEDDDYEFSHCGSSTVQEEAGEDTTESVDIFELSRNTNSGPTRSQRKDIAYLKKNPGMLFPKMNKLILCDLLGDNEPFDITAAQAMQSRSKRRSTVTTLKASRESIEPKPTAKSARQKPESSSLDYVKLIQKLTTYLPDHLADTAKEQIREMTQSDAIQEQKEKILDHNKSKLTRDVAMGDSRWEKLEKSLSSNYGINQKWKRVQATGAWIKVQAV